VPITEWLANLPERAPTSIDADLQRELLASINLAADAAAQITLANFRQDITIDNKSSTQQLDPVTVADRQAERAIREVLYITGSVQWGTLIGLYDGSGVPIGLMDQPYLGERLVGSTDGTELTVNGSSRWVKTSKAATLRSAIFQTTTPDSFTQPSEAAALQAVKTHSAMCRYGGDCYAYALLAMGFVDIVLETGLKPYDIQALIPIVRGAGGCITTWQGGNPAAGGDILATAHAALHDEVLELLRTTEAAGTNGAPHSVI